MAPIRILLAVIAAIVGLILVVPVFLLSLPLWIVSMLTRGVCRLVEPRFLNRDELIEFDPDFGWKPRPNLNTHHLMADLFHIKTDADGWRGNATLQESEIVIIGDSFAAGYGVGERHFFANLNRRPKIKPIGIGGYSMVQELLWIKHLASQLRGKLVVWFVYHGNDLYDNLSPDLRGYRKPFVREGGRSGDWEIVSRHISRAQWPIVTRVRLEGQHHLAKLAELCSDTFLAERAYSACAYLIRSAKQICAEAGADLVIMTIPDACQLTPEGQSGLKARGADPRSFDPYLPDKRLDSICGSLEVSFVAGKSFLDVSCYKKNDCHWNALGHRKVAKALAELYASRRIRRIGSEGKLDGTMATSGELNPAAKSASRGNRFLAPDGIVRALLGFITRLLVPPYQPKRPPSRTVAILVPVSNRKELTPEEKISMRHLVHYLGSYPKYLIVPRGMDFHVEGFTVKSFSRKYFGSMRAHSRLLYLPMFWETFEDYEYVLMYHLDALVFRDELLQWCKTGLDYIGAPFIPCADTPWVKEPYVGNGGFALMNVEAVLRVLYTRYRAQPAKYWEDRCAGLLNVLEKTLRLPRRLVPDLFRGPMTVPLRRQVQKIDQVEVNVRNNDRFWSEDAVKYVPDFRIPDWRTGLRFAFETDPRHCFVLNRHELPFGCHAWPKYDRSFWEPHLLTSPSHRAIA